MKPIEDIIRVKKNGFMDLKSKLSLIAVEILLILMFFVGQQEILQPFNAHKLICQMVALCLEIKLTMITK
jgi:hypothetical protein